MEYKTVINRKILLMLLISLSAHMAIAAAIVYVPNEMIGNNAARRNDSVIWGYVEGGRKQSHLSTPAPARHPEPAAETQVMPGQNIQTQVQDETGEEISVQNEVPASTATREQSVDNNESKKEGCYSPDSCDSIYNSNNGHGSFRFDKLALAEYVRKEIERLKYYPDIARLRGIEGTVFINFYIGQDGIPSSIAIARSSGSRILDDAGVKTVGMIGKLSDLHKDLRELDIVVPITYRLNK